MATSNVLAIDLGTSGPKVALVDDDGALTGQAFEPIGLELHPGGGAEQDPDLWWEAIRLAVRSAVTDAGVAPDAISAVAVTAQWSGTVPVDRRGATVGNAIIWMDSRGGPQVDALRGGRVRLQGYDPRKLRTWIQRTGGAPNASGKDPVAHISWLREERPDIFGRTATFFEPKDYINFRLTGRRTATFDSIALHWVTDNRDPLSIRYDPELLTMAGLSKAQLPDLHAATDVVGSITEQAAADLGLAAGIPVVGGTPDLHSAAIGAGTTDDHQAHLYVGTSAWLICHVPFKKTDILHNIASLPAAIPGRYLVANEQETAGKAVEWIGRVLFPESTDNGAVLQTLNALAAAAEPGSGGVVFTPWLYGERTPVEDSTLRGGFFNQSLESGRAELVRAVFEGVAYNARWLLRHVERFAGATLDPIVMVGGGAQSNLWCQIHADVLGRTIRQAAEPLHVNVRGAGLLAHVALGNLAWSEIPDRVPIAREFHPSPEVEARYDTLFDAFRRIHKANRRTYRGLNR